MANIKISELNELTNIATDDLLPIVDTSVNETKKVQLKNVLNVELIAISDTAPAECLAGDKYYNTEDNKIYTAIATDTWGTIGETPVKGVFYIVFNEQSSYSYDGSTLISVGGGTEDIVISDTEPTEEGVKLWIDTGEIGSQVSEITNEYSTSTGLGYSANYTNNLHTYSTDEIRIGTWVDGKPIYRKVVSSTTPSQVDTGTNIYNATSLNIDKIINMTFTFQGDFNEYATASNVIILFTRLNSGERNIGCTCTIQNYCNRPFYFMLEYTKTTD